MTHFPFPKPRLSKFLPLLLSTRPLHRPFAIALFLALIAPHPAIATNLTFGNATLSLDPAGNVTRIATPGVQPFSPSGPRPIARLNTPGGPVLPASVTATSSAINLNFTDGSRARFTLEPQKQSTVVRLAATDLRTSGAVLQFPIIPPPHALSIDSTLNAARLEDGTVLAVMAASPEVVPSTGQPVARVADLPGCSHQFTLTTGSKTGGAAARFSATNTLKTAGWAMQGRNFSPSEFIADIAGVSAWVHGDSGGEHLKFQLLDEHGGARDFYLPIDFTGWRHVELTTAALDIMHGTRLAGINLYYNGIPPTTSVTCIIDDIKILKKPAAPNAPSPAVMLEDFEETQSSWWTNGTPNLQLEWDFRYAKPGDAVGIIACPEPDLFSGIREFERAAGILVPYPGGVWNKTSPLIKQSYLFLTAFSEKHFDQALDLAKRGGFHQVLLEQHSWCKSTGHYGINTANFPDGLAGLVRTVKRFRAEGIDVGLHLLGASVDNNDPYITPVPDPRLYKDTITTLTSPIDAQTTTIIVDAMPNGFPAEDGGYTGDGTVLQVGDELINYTSRTTTAPFTFTGCTRGHHGTRAAAHEAGQPVHHLARSYGYHMFDMDTTLLDEVTSNFAAVANACDIGMVYFDGSERLQGNHARYNARLINAYLTKLHRKDILVQASSFSHFSWHQLARSASADGHGDLKGYLEQRAPSFKHFAQIGMPLDIGWYYGYDKSATPDMYEYILGTTLGYDSSFSYQVSPTAASAHPFTGDILRMIQSYDSLRAAGTVSPAMRELLQVPDGLLGKAPEDPTRPTELRRDYHLESGGAGHVFQRVIYGQWQDGSTTAAKTAWEINLTTGPVQVGMQLQVLPQKADVPTTAGAGLTDPAIEVGGQSIKWHGTLAPGQYLTLWPGQPPILRGPDATLSMESALADSATTASFAGAQLSAGKYTASFSATASGTDPATTASYRVRLFFLTPERHPVPGAKP